MCIVSQDIRHISVWEFSHTAMCHPRMMSLPIFQEMHLKFSASWHFFSCVCFTERIYSSMGVAIQLWFPLMCLVLMTTLASKMVMCYQVLYIKHTLLKVSCEFLSPKKNNNIVIPAFLFKHLQVCGGVNGHVTSSTCCTVQRRGNPWWSGALAHLEDSSSTLWTWLVFSSGSWGSIQKLSQSFSLVSPHRLYDYAMMMAV